MNAKITLIFIWIFSISVIWIRHLKGILKSVLVLKVWRWDDKFSAKKTKCAKI